MRLTLFFSVTLPPIEHDSESVVAPSHCLLDRELELSPTSGALAHVLEANEIGAIRLRRSLEALRLDRQRSPNSPKRCAVVELTPLQNSY
ncbi:hypothetical protein [Mesorhizobium ventifaucium]|uniref:Secreted protein n=1 Tax=Mesorhizobium escarrei TaxID=666018 RepID=A0ABN8JAP9_9HYPH|nr:hypothetical protein MES5069_100025 [Mesorhizobium escarrei]